MRKIKSRNEILESPYVTKTEVQRLFGESYRTTSRVYSLALQKDLAELEGRMIYPDGEKVRLSSVCWVMGIRLKDLKSGTHLQK